jgi:hypothetical protein
MERYGEFDGKMRFLRLFLVPFVHTWAHIAQKSAYLHTMDKSRKRLVELYLLNRLRRHL